MKRILLWYSAKDKGETRTSTFIFHIDELKKSIREVRSFSGTYILSIEISTMLFPKVLQRVEKFLRTAGGGNEVSDFRVTRVC